MANLVIKPASGSTNKLVFQNQAGNVDAITVEDSGNTTLAGTANNLGTVTAGSIAGGTITSATTFPAGMVVNSGYKEDAVRASLPRGDESIFGTLTMSYNKLHASSILCVSGIVIGRDDQDGHCGTGFKYGTSAAVWCGSFTYEGANYMVNVSISGVLVGHTTTGSQTLSLVYGSNNGNLGPFQVMNPSNTDTTEFIASKPNVSTMKVWEILT